MVYLFIASWLLIGAIATLVAFYIANTYLDEENTWGDVIGMTLFSSLFGPFTALLYALILLSATGKFDFIKEWTSKPAFNKENKE